MNRITETKSPIKSYNLIVNKLINTEKYQDVFEEKYKNKSSLIHGKPTIEFCNYIHKIALKFLEKKGIDTSDLLKINFGKKNEDFYILDTCRSCKFIKYISEETELCQSCSKKNKGKTKNSKTQKTDSEIQIEGVYEEEDIGNRIKVPAVFRATYDEIWVPIINDEIKMYKEGHKRMKGFIFLLTGKGKVGKTHLAMSSVEFNGYTSKYRDVPKGRPVYIVEADAATRDEAETKWYKYLPSDKYPKGLIHIKQCFVKDENTKLIDPEATLENMYAGIFSLENRTHGTLIVDPFTLMTDLMLFVYMIKHKDKNGMPDITFDEFLKPSREILIVEHQYKKKLVYEILRKLRMYQINIILIGNVKPIYTDGKTLYDRKPTDKYEDDVQKGTEYWVDIIGRLYKTDVKKDMKTKKGDIVKKAVTKRILAVTDCRFEEKEIIQEKYKFEAPKFADVINHLMEVYPK